MKISLRATYGIIAAVELALHEGDQPVQAKAIARRQGIPTRFLEQVLHAMKKADLVTSHRGAQGGYVLNRRPQQLTLAQIVEALEGPVFSTNGSTPTPVGGPNPKIANLLAPVWQRVKQAEQAVLSEVTIEELAERQRRLDPQRLLMYHI
jgi:Rrf2 family protein